MPDRIMFATDYPHWDFDAPERALPSVVRGELRDAIMGANARALYRLPGDG
jgi:predicted TIM-barrel fold metal-dependent hydrolase